LLGYKTERHSKSPSTASQSREKFRFLAKFTSREEEAKYEEWKKANNVKHFFHESDIETWPRECQITVLATPDKIQWIQQSPWFIGEWKPETLKTATK